MALPMNGSSLECPVNEPDTPAPPRAVEPACFHCGSPCGRAAVVDGGKSFCCQGCLTVHDLLARNGLGDFYHLDRHPGVRPSEASPASRWSFLNDPAVEAQMLDFSDGRTNRVTFHIPAIHCVACVWLLENLYRLHPGVGRSQVNFPRREVTISFEAGKIQLGGVAALLSSIGYTPELTLSTLNKPAPDRSRRRRALQTGVAGFAFGNIMLFSLPGYLGLDSASGPLFRTWFGVLSLLLSLPVLVFSASDYWRSAWVSFRQRTLTLDVPIALGLAALSAQSVWEIVGGRGEGYLDSMVGLIFFLLCGRWFQQKTHDRLAFDRDYRSFFPLSVVRQSETGEETVALSRLRVGDRLVLRHGELVPADARLVRGEGWIDYSFVTGEATPVERGEGELLYAGGQQLGGRIEVETVKPVSQGYLTALWNDPVFQKPRATDWNTLTNRYSRVFTVVVIGVALTAAGVWAGVGNPGRGLKAFVSVLIVACPCALALAAPFTLGTAQRWLAHLEIFLRDGQVIEDLARTDTIVFDKTGTLTSAREQDVSFRGATLAPKERMGVGALARHSAHPLARRLGEVLADSGGEGEVEGFLETTGRGVAGGWRGHAFRLGSRTFLEEHNVVGLEPDPEPGGSMWLAIDGQFRGVFCLSGRLRRASDRLIARLADRHELVLLSGDHDGERERFRELFGAAARLRFNQSPQDKLGFIRELQSAGRTVLMVGDGLNDAGALRQSDVGVAVVERVGIFSPASDVILSAARVPELAELLSVARQAVRIVRLSFRISAAYNIIGVSIAAAGMLSPLWCAILMPLSSVSVVLVACGLTTRAVRRSGLRLDLEQG